VHKLVLSDDLDSIQLNDDTMKNQA